MESDANSKLAHRYEIAVSVFLLALTFLWRDNPEFVFPEILYVIVLLLGVNLGTGVVMRRLPVGSWFFAPMTMANCAVITAALRCSGGAESRLWVLYLLPIFTSCLLLTGRQVLWVLLGTLTFNGAFHATAAAVFGRQELFELVLKSGVLVFSGAAGWKLASRQRAAAERADRQRLDLARLEAQAAERESRHDASDGEGDLGLMVSRLTHDLRTPVAIILGSTELLLLQDELPHDELRRDLERIQRSAKSCSTRLDWISGIAGRKEFHPVPCDFPALLTAALTEAGPSLQRRRLSVETVCGDGLPQVSLDAPQLERVLRTLLAALAENLRDDGRLTVSTEAVLDEGILSRIRCAFRSEDAVPGNRLDLDSTVELCLAREIVRRHGGELVAEETLGTRIGAFFTLPAPSPSPTI
ncbi:MAG: hypothetical protein A2X36_12245 [Elusimicrobia bacterium GWA2_69_24]|nr:MAG: hypothetical protein A2X36_12245 [Elusimicrobia bacterium GWA2_69_24]HBL17761.1 hypothetical protein [Elusimicrobiota bacterium]